MRMASAAFSIFCVIASVTACAASTEREEGDSTEDTSGAREEKAPAEVPAVEVDKVTPQSGNVKCLGQCMYGMPPEMMIPCRCACGFPCTV